MTPNEALGQVIAEFQDAAGITQAQLAEKLGPGWSQPKISLVRAGKQAVDMNEVEQIAQALGKLGEDLLMEAFKRYRRFISQQKPRET
jgi:transcriptional regulator with XRE-family HTH domain